MPEAPATAARALTDIWTGAGLDPAAIARVTLPDEPQILRSSFATGVAAQASIGAAALAAEQLYADRCGEHQTIAVAKADAERECTGWFTLDGSVPQAWEKFSGLYPTADGHVRVHANFEHHRDGVLRLLGLPEADTASKDDVAAALGRWSAQTFEDQAAAMGLAVSRVRSFDEWDAHPHANATRRLPLLTIEQIGDAPPRALPPINPDERPLTGTRVLDLTRILAGPICGRTLAAYGADVMLINGPQLPNIAAITDTSRGKRSAHVDLTGDRGRADLRRLLTDAHVFVQGYRPGALDRLGFSPESLARDHPGIVCVSLSAYGPTGPWRERRGFDSLVQTATGFNHAEAVAAGQSAPRALPQQILDFASGFLMAFGAQVALRRQATQGGSWLVRVSLLQTAHWLRSLGRLDNGFAAGRVDLEPYLQQYACDHGVLQAMPHAARFSATPARWRRPSAMPGTHTADWHAPGT